MIFFALLSVPAFSQTATVQGECKDDQGNPIIDAQVTWHNEDNGRTYRLKTDKHGKYFSLGVDPGTYTVTLAKDGKQLDQVNKLKVDSSGMNEDFDLKKSQQEEIQQTAKAKGITPDQVKQMQEQAEKAQAYNKNIGAVNDKLKAATADEQANPPNYDGAIATLTDATQIAPNEDLVWFRLGSAYLESTKTQTDAGEKTKRYAEAYNDLQKSIDLYKSKTGSAVAPAGGAPAAAGALANGAAPANGSAPASGAAPANAPANGQPAAPQGGKPQAVDNVRLATYYDNFAAAAAKVGKNDEAVDGYKQAAQLDPAHAGHYDLNLGITLMNSGNSKDATDAFDKAIAADPNNALAYFFKGQGLFAGVTTDSSGKMTAPPGTEEALNKYLELQPSGPYSQPAKDMLAALGTKVETSYGTKKKK